MTKDEKQFMLVLVAIFGLALLLVFIADRLKQQDLQELIKAGVDPVIAKCLMR